MLCVPVMQLSPSNARRTKTTLLGRFSNFCDGLPSGSQRRSREDDLESALMRRNGTNQEECLADFHAMTAFTFRQHSI